MAVKTYAVGVFNTVHRLDDHTLPWVDVSIPIVEAGNFYDVMTDPSNASKVIAVGDFRGVGTNTGIMVSDDAGATWTQAGGDWVTAIGGGPHARNFRVFELWFVDSNTIWAIGSGTEVLLSLDGGLTFNKTASFPFTLIHATFAIHAISDQVAIVSGSEGKFVEVSKTTDGGVTWTNLSGTPLPEGITLDPRNSRGIWMSDDEQTIIVSTDAGRFISTDGGLSFIPKLPDADNELHLTWYPDYGTPNVFRVTGSGSFGIAESVDNGNTWSTNYISPNTVWSAHFYSNDAGYYLEGSSIYHTTDGGVTGTLSEENPSIQALLAVWTGNETKASMCWIATNCEDAEDTIRIQFEDPDYIPNLDLIYQFTEFGDACYSLVLNMCNEEVEPITIVTISATSDSCINCTSTCYTLVDCNTQESWLVRNDFFAAYIGRVLEITRLGESGQLETTCITVTLAGCLGEPDDFAFTFIDCWDTCEECQEAQPVPEVPASTAVPITQRTVKPGWNPKGCSPEYVEKISCNFAEALYQEAASKRYGIEFCCNEDKDKWLVKYEMLELKALQDPDACKTVECCPPCNLEAVINYVCPDVTGLIGRIND